MRRFKNCIKCPFLPRYIFSNFPFEVISVPLSAKYPSHFIRFLEFLLNKSNTMIT